MFLRLAVPTNLLVAAAACAIPSPQDGLTWPQRGLFVSYSTRGLEGLTNKRGVGIPSNWHFTRGYGTGPKRSIIVGCCLCRH